MEALKSLAGLIAAHPVPILIYFGVMTLVTFIVYGADKSKAKRGAWRVPEATLLLLAFMGGSIGALLGMRIFRHKTKHVKFIILVPLALILQLALAVGVVLLPRLSL